MTDTQQDAAAAAALAAMREHEQAAAAALHGGVETGDIPAGVDPETGEITGPLGEPAGPAGPAEPEPEPAAEKKSTPSSYFILVAVTAEPMSEEQIHGRAPLPHELPYTPLSGTFAGDGQEDAKRSALEQVPQLQERAKQRRLVLAAVPMSSWKPRPPRPREQKISWVV